MSGLNNRELGIQAGPYSNGPPRFSLQDKGGIDMTADIDRAEVFSRPAARFDEDGQLEIRASSALGCRRALWYAATGYESTNPPSEDSLTAMEAGNALEPVVLRAMERAGWRVDPADPRNPESVSIRLRPSLVVTGHPDATGRMPSVSSTGQALDGDEAVSEVQTFLFGDGPQAPRYGDEMVVEVKTRGPEAFKRWRTLGAERSHPASVAQAAFYTYGKFGGWPRDAVIATMDTGGRTWDYEIIPADRLERALDDACKWLGELAAHHVRNGPDPDALPDRDFSAGSWQCRSCPFLVVCQPGAAEADDETEMEGEEVSDQEAREAVAAYAEAQEAIKEPEKVKRSALDTLKAWMRRQGDSKATVNGRTVSLVQSKRYSVDYRKLNEALDPDVRAGIVTEGESEYVRVS